MKPALERVADLLLDRKRPDRPLVVGVTGIDAAGKTAFAGRLAASVQARGTPVQLVHVDDFHNPRSVRYAPGAPGPVQYYQQGFDFGRLVDEVLRPIRETGELDTTLTLLDLATDAWSVRRRYSVTAGTVVVVEGVFLLRPEVRPWLDVAVYLRVTERTAVERARARDVPVHGEQILRRYRDRYLPAQRAHLADHRPDESADVIVDNDDWSRPVLRSP